jgi:L-ascorbate metabolism protein UlaG (beta-lactamase superfamily)
MCVLCAIAALRPHESGADPFPAASPPIARGDRAPIGVSATWTGVAGLVLECEGVRIAFDPFVSRPSLAATLLRRPALDRGAVARAFAGLDAVFVGHAHFDHAMDLPAVADVSPRARFHGGPTAMEIARRGGVPASRLVACEDRAVAQAGPFRVEAVRSAHGVVPLVRLVDRAGPPRRGLPRTPFRYPRGEVLAWRVTVRGRAIHVQGSAGIDDEALARQEPVDVLAACVAARAGTPRYLARLGERLAPSVLLPLHHDDFFRSLDEPPRPIATLRWASFLEEAEALRRAHGTALALPVRGRALAL